MATQNTTKHFIFPHPITNHPKLNFNFSNLKTFTTNTIHNNNTNNQTHTNITHTFKNTIINTLIIKYKQTLNQTNFKQLIITNNINTNHTLQTKLTKIIKKHHNKIFYTHPKFYTNNNTIITYTKIIQFKTNTTTNLNINIHPH